MSKKTKDKIAVVIPVINLWDKYTKRTLESIKSEDNELIFIIIDNNSIDKTKEEAEKRQGENFVYIRNDKNIGVASSWNLGIKKGIEKDCEYFFIINNDLLFQSNTIDTIVKRFHNNTKEENIGIITAHNIQGELDSPQDIFDYDYRKKIDIPESEHPDFSAFMLTKKCYNEVGQFDENFYPAYFEDNDYHYRLYLKGIKAINYPMAVYYHFGSRSKKFINNFNTLFEKNREYYKKKWGGIPGEEIFKSPFNSDL